MKAALGMDVDKLSEIPWGFSIRLEDRLRSLWPRIVNGGRFQLDTSKAQWCEVTIPLERDGKPIPMESLRENELQQAADALADEVISRSAEYRKILFVGVPTVSIPGVLSATHRTMESGISSRVTIYRDKGGMFATFDVLFWEAA